MLLSIKGCTIATLDIEDNIAYTCQKYMNEQEYVLLEEGISYMDTVAIADGADKKIENNEYVWQNEIVRTRAYEVRSENNKLVSKIISKKRGYSTR